MCQTGINETVIKTDYLIQIITDLEYNVFLPAWSFEWQDSLKYLPLE